MALSLSLSLSLPSPDNKASRGYADILSERTKAGRKAKAETPEPASAGSSRSYASRRHYAAEASPFKSVERGTRSTAKARGSAASTPSNLNSSSAISQNDSPRFSNTFKEARKAVCDLYTIWRHEFEEKQIQPASASKADAKPKVSKTARQDPRRTDDGKLELPPNAVEYLSSTVEELQEEAKYLGGALEAYHKGIVQLLDRNKGRVDVEAMNKKSLREKGAPLESLKSDREDKLGKQASEAAVRRLERSLEESQAKYSDAVRKIAECQNAIGDRDADLRRAEVELEERSAREKALGAKCDALASQLEEESNRSSEALRELQRSQGSKDGQTDAVIKSIQESLEQKTRQCSDLQKELTGAMETAATRGNEVDRLRAEVRRRDDEAGRKLELTLGEVETLKRRCAELSDSSSRGKEESEGKLRAYQETIEAQGAERDALEGELRRSREEAVAKGREVDRLAAEEKKFEALRGDVSARMREIQGLNESLSSALREIDGAEQLAAVLTKDINEALGNYAEDVLSGKTPRGIASSRNPFDLPRKAGKWEDEKEGGEPKADPVPKSLDRIIGSNGGPALAAAAAERRATEDVQSGEAGAAEALASLLSDLGIVAESAKADPASAVASQVRDLKSQVEELKAGARQREVEILDMEAQTKELQGKLMRAQQELDETRFHPEVSIGSAVASPSRSRSHTVDNAAFKEHSSLSENPAMMINDNEDIEFSSSDEEEAGGDTSRRSSQFKRGSKSMFSRQNSKQITDGIAEDLRTENDSLRVKLTQTELENEALQRKLKEKEREMGKQTTREMETIRRASAVYDTQTVPGQKGFWKGKRGRGNSKGNGEEMQTLVADLTARYSDLSLKFAEKCTEADELKHQLKRKDVEIVALKEIYAIPDILEQNNNIWVSFRVFIPGDDDKGVPTCLLVGTDGIYIPHWQDQQFYDYTTIAKFEVRDNEFVFWALTSESRKLNEVNLFCNAVLPNAILSSIQSAIKVKLDVHNTATSSIRVVSQESE